jgi:hypothetical protein
LTGLGKRNRTFTDGNYFTELLKRSSHIGQLREGVCSGAMPPQGSFPNNLSGVQGVPKYVRDYTTVATGGMTGNLAPTYLGSYGLTYAESGGTIDVHVTNTSTISSALRPPVIGYTEWWSNNVGAPLDAAFSSGPMSKTTQTFDFQVSCAAP